MAKFGSGRKPANQGSAGTAYTQAPGTSSKPAKGTEAPQTPQDYRGFHTSGKGGTGKNAGRPQSFKG